MIIFCLVLGDSPKKHFSIDIDPSRDTSVEGKEYSFDQLNFGHFQKLVRAEIKYTSRASDLELWKVFIPTKGDEEKLKILQDYAINKPRTEINIEKQLGGVELVASTKIKEIFNKDPEDDHIHIIIKRPAEGPSLKRARIEEGKYSQNKEEPPWLPSPKKQKIMTHGTATLFAGKSIPIGWESFGKIVNGGCTFLDKTSLIAEFIECNSKVSLVVRPRRFGKTINLTMLRDFFSIPVHPDNKDYRRELFKDTKIMKERSELFNEYFCKYPVIFLSLKDFDGCKTWSEMQAQLCQQLATLYEEHKYVYEILSNSPLNSDRFKQINSGVLMDGITKNALLYLSKYLKDYHRSGCIVLIDEYDHPLDIAYRYQYYEEARDFFASLFGALLKSNDENLEKAFLVGVSRVAKSGYLSGLNNLDVFPMHVEEYADKFGFTEDEISILFKHYNKEDQLIIARQWYDGYEAGNGIHLYNPWSINKFIRTNVLKAYWADTGGTQMIKELLWRSSDYFKDQVVKLITDGVTDTDILGDIKEDIDYNLLSNNFVDDDVMWTLLYYSGYLTYDGIHLRIPNKEVFTEWVGWIRLKGIKKNEPNLLLNMLLEGDLATFEKEFPNLIMSVLSYHDVRDNLVESNYHLFTVGLFAQAQFCGYKVDSNKECGLGLFDMKIVPDEGANHLTSVIAEFKAIKNKNNDDDEYCEEFEEIKSDLNEKDNKVDSYLQKEAIEGFEQILKKKYEFVNSRSTKLVECGIAFQGKRVCVLGRVLQKQGNEWIEIYCSKALSDHMNANKQ